MQIFFRILSFVGLLVWSVVGQAQSAGQVSPMAVAATPSERATGIDVTPVAQFMSTYRLGAGDVISVRVFGEDDLSREKIRLTDSGSIFMPGMGEMVVQGKTLGEVERLVVDGLSGRILVNPKVSVSVDEYRPFFINGMVEKPGGYPFQPGLTLRKAASLAGGFKDRASMSKLFVIRGDDPQQRQYKIDMNAAIFPGDIITVEESFF